MCGGKLGAIPPRTSTQSLDGMATCPHCNVDSISAAAKLWSGKGSPTVCRRCGGYSYSPRISLNALVFGQALAVAALLGAFLMWHWWPLAALSLSLAAWALWRVKRVPLVAVSPTQAAQNRSDGNAFLLLAVAAAVVIALMVRGIAV